MVAEDNEVGASERWTGIEPAQLADWTVDGSALLMVIDRMITWSMELWSSTIRDTSLQYPSLTTVCHNQQPLRSIVPTMADDADEDNASRRAEELDALRSFYGDDLLSSSNRTKEDDGDGPTVASVDGPWRIRVAKRIVLEIHLPSTYPSSSGTPTPILQAPQWALDEGRRSDLLAELEEMHVPDLEVAIMWAEHCRAELDDGNNGDVENGSDADNNDDDGDGGANQEGIDNDSSQSADTATKTFIPPSSKHGQPIRHFDASVVMEEANRRPIHRGQPFHPPKSGPSELMLAHVASVESMNHVNWVLAELLFNDKKVAKASHNMIAYRFYDKERGCMVSDNDDDGEKGSGAKLAALLEMSDTMDCIVVVSRWYGGIHLGPARFKHIASTARDALVESRLIGGGSSAK